MHRVRVEQEFTDVAIVREESDCIGDGLRGVHAPETRTGWPALLEAGLQAV